MMTFLRYILLFLSCPAWGSFYLWIHAYVRTINICIETIKNGRNVLFKILAFIVCLLTCGVVQIVFCVFGIVYLFMGPCQSFAESREETRIGYLKIVQGEHFPIYDSVKGTVLKIFA